MSRAFSTLEGIGLSQDENYSILQECYPYLAKRLLSDDSPRARGALKTLLYGKDGEELDLSKLKELSSGFESYTSSTSSVESGKGTSDEGRDSTISQLADVILSEESNYVQDILLHESAVALDASVRDALLTPLDPLRNVPLPSLPLITLPFDVAKATLDLQSIDDKDHKALENVKILTDALGGSSGGGLSSNLSSGNSSIGPTRIIEEASKRQTALTRIGLRFGSSLANVQSKRLRQRAENGSKNEVVRDRLAEQGADALDFLSSTISSIDKRLGK